MPVNIIQLDHFISSTRDSGYKSLSSALAELIDNSIESGATKVEIKVHKQFHLEEEQFEVCVIDNGKGMTKEDLTVALQFGVVPGSIPEAGLAGMVWDYRIVR